MLSPNKDGLDEAGHLNHCEDPLPDPGIVPVPPALDVERASKEEGFGEWAEWMGNRYRL